MGMYWDTKIQDKALITYKLSTDEYDRNYIWKEYLHKPFDKMAENIIHTFKIHDYIKETFIELKRNLVTKCIMEFDNWNETKGNAFSYFSTVMKYHLIQLNQKGYKEYLKVDSLDKYDSNNSVESKNKPDEYPILAELSYAQSLADETKQDRANYAAEKIKLYKNNVDLLTKKEDQRKLIKEIFDISTVSFLENLKYNHCENKHTPSIAFYKMDKEYRKALLKELHLRGFNVTKKEIQNALVLLRQFYDKNDKLEKYMSEQCKANRKKIIDKWNIFCSKIGY